jgi:hypothetical protein
MSKHPRDEFNGPAEPWPPQPDEPHPRAYAIGYLIGLVIAYIRSLFGRKPPRPPRPRSPNRWVWWLVGIVLALIFWQPLLIIALLLLGALIGHAHSSVTL